MLTQAPQTPCVCSRPLRTAKKLRMGASSSKDADLTINRSDFHTFEEFERALRDARVECARFVIAVDFTESNERRGVEYNDMPLHRIRSASGYDIKSPYEAVLELIEPTIASFESADTVTLLSYGLAAELQVAETPIPEVVPLYRALADRYARQQAEGRLYPASSIAPAVYKTLELVAQRMEMHVLIIITDGDINDVGRDSQAVVDASYFPLSIIVVGIGNSRFEHYKTFDEVLYERRFDNFNFVNFGEANRAMHEELTPETFAIEIYSEIPAQFAEMRRLRYFES